MSNKAAGSPTQLNLFASSFWRDAEADVDVEHLKPTSRPAANAKPGLFGQLHRSGSHPALEDDDLDLLPGLTTTVSVDPPVSGSASDSLAGELGSKKPARSARSKRGTGARRGQRSVPGHLSLVQIVSGEESMQARALELYSVYADLAHVSPLEIRRAGSQISLSEINLNALKARYLTRDASFQRILSGEGADAQVDFSNERYLADERARKRIARATRDLVGIGAILLNQEGHPGVLRRLPELHQFLTDHGVTHVRLCPGGKRRLCDGSGREIRPVLTQTSALPATRTTSQKVRRHG